MARALTLQLDFDGDAPEAGVVESVDNAVDGDGVTGLAVDPPEGFVSENPLPSVGVGFDGIPRVYCAHLEIGAPRPHYGVVLAGPVGRVDDEVLERFGRRRRSLNGEHQNQKGAEPRRPPVRRPRFDARVSELVLAPSEIVLIFYSPMISFHQAPGGLNTYDSL